MVTLSINYVKDLLGRKYDLTGECCGCGFVGNLWEDTTIVYDEGQDTCYCRECWEKTLKSMEDEEGQQTPGPWRFHVAEVGFSVLADDDRCLIAKVCEQANPQETEANAILLAAAPGLLHELESVMDQLDGLGVAEWQGAEGLYLEGAKEILKLVKGKQDA